MSIAHESTSVVSRVYTHSSRHDLGRRRLDRRHVTRFRRLDELRVERVGGSGVKLSAPGGSAEPAKKGCC